ncbi:carboxypeptidase B-like [Hyposmocoma kahamanoa]|uniref:carboxypeptidase B-like n=1 Tax=Hyposmocoma kahamanoa TaxID=1477025 RepID=UPI000E6DA385|nr:carboxypeptidase B-like [Hyposmocoma kahamanoa]
MILKLLLLVISVVLLVEAKNEDYKGYRIYNVKFKTEEQQNGYNKLKSDIIDFIRRPSFGNNIVGKAVVPPSHFDFFEEQLEELAIPIDVAVEDLYEHLETVEKSRPRTTNDDPDREFDFDRYHRYEQILNHLHALQEAHENSTIRITVNEFDRTDEDRPIVYLTVSENSATTDKPVVIIEGGINPREWITVPAALNIVNSLTQNAASFLSRADWIIVPVLNPDGYEYTHTNLRLWTKNRSIKSNLGFICPGVNINRNFDVQWGVSDSSSSPCSHMYAGVEAFSEIETQLIKHLIEKYSGRIRLYLSLQNNGGFVSYPWQYERAASGMFRQHHLLGMDMVAAMNESYSLNVGWYALGDRASGTGADYAQMNGVVYSLNIDAVQRGDDGVNIPENEIVGVIEDIWRAVEVAVNDVLN